MGVEDAEDYGTLHCGLDSAEADEVIKNGQMRLVKVPTSAQMADILTKGLHLPQVLACVNGLLQLDIDLNPDYPSPGNSECGGRPVG